MVYPNQPPLHLHERTWISRQPRLHDKLRAMACTRPPRAAEVVPRHYNFFDPARSAAEENSRQASMPPGAMPSISPPSSPLEVRQGSQPQWPSHNDPRERSPPLEDRVYVKREPSSFSFPSPSPIVSPCAPAGLAPAPAGAPAATPAIESPACSDASVCFTDAVVLDVSDGCASAVRSLSASSANEELDPNLYNNVPPSSHTSFSPPPVAARAQRQHDLLQALERICTAAAATYWCSQHYSAIDQHAAPSRHPRRHARHVSRCHGAHQTNHTRRFHPYDNAYANGTSHRNYLPDSPLGPDSPSSRISRHPGWSAVVTTPCPLALMDYLRRIAQMLWTRATRAGAHAEELEAVHRMGNLYAWGEKVVAATVLSGAAAARERERDSARERNGLMRGGNGAFDLNGRPTDVEGSHEAMAEARVGGEPHPQPQPQPDAGAEAEAEDESWARADDFEIEETGSEVMRRGRRERMPPRPRWHEVPDDDDDDAEAQGEGCLTEEALLQVVMAGRDLVGWLLSEDGKREVDTLWVGRAVSGLI